MARSAAMPRMPPRRSNHKAVLRDADLSETTVSNPSETKNLRPRFQRPAPGICNMEQRAQAHAQKLKRLRDVDPLGAHGSTNAALSAAAHLCVAGGIARVILRLA